MENKNQTFKDRLELIMKEKDLNANRLASEIDTNAANIYRYLGEESQMPSEAILEKFTKLGYSKKWLKYGEGEKIETYKSPNSSDPLMQTLERIENSFATVLEEKQQIIEDMRFTIDLLRSQLAASPGKLEPTTEQNVGVFTYQKRLPEVA